MQVLYNNQGHPVTIEHMIDVKAAVASGRYFYEPPGNAAALKVEEPKEPDVEEKIEEEKETLKPKTGSASKKTRKSVTVKKQEDAKESDKASTVEKAKNEKSPSQPSFSFSAEEVVEDYDSDY